MVIPPERLVAEHLDWLRAKFRTAEVGDSVEVTTPFLDRHNDHIQYYVQSQAGKFRLTDDGYTIGDLEASGCALDTDSRRQMLDAILNGFGVREKDGEIIVDASADDLPRKQHAILQAMLAVNGLSATAKPRVQRLFREDVAIYFKRIGATYAGPVEFQGKSGYSHRFDFVVPMTVAKPERIIKAINTPCRDTITSTLFAWSDAKVMRPTGTVAYAILNDVDPLPSGILSHFASYDIRTVLWSQRDLYAADFAA